MPEISHRSEPSQNLLRVPPGILVVGKPLPWPVYNEQGDVLLMQGYVIQNEGQLEKLYKLGMFYPHHAEDTGEKVEDPVNELWRNPFTDYRALLKGLERTHQAIARKDPEAGRKLLGLARRMEQLCRQAPDPTLALVHLYSTEPSATEQSLFHAIVCHFTAVEADIDAEHRITLMAAALTANLALIPILDRLNASSHELSDQQRSIIRRHPALAAEALQKAGVDDPVLLTIIRQHHERSDGSGYPDGLEGDQILPEASILALSEHYVALITRRGYRDRRGITQARKLIADAAQYSTRPRLFQALLNALTPYPPGALVRLANNEIAVVTHRPLAHQGHRVKAITDPSHRAYPKGFSRDTDLLEFNIRAVELGDILPPMEVLDLWDYPA